MSHRSIAVATACCLVSLVLAAVPCGGQERPKEKTVFSGETTVVAVELPVEVILNGEPVRGLTAENFRVFEGSEPRPLTGFEVVDLGMAGTPSNAATEEGAATAPGGRPASAVPPAARRHFLLLFDLSFTRAGFLPRAIEGARHLVREGLQPSDLVGVAFYSDRRGASMVLQFTSDRSQVETVLDAFSSALDGKPHGADGPDLARPADPLGLTSGGWLVALGAVGQAAGFQTSDWGEALAAGGEGGGRTGISSGVVEESAAAMAQVFEEQRASQVSYLVDSLAELCRSLSAVQGSKHLVLFSQGFDARLLEVKPGSGAVGSGGGSWVLREANDMVRELQKAGWVIHGAHLSGLANPFEARGAANFQAGLFYLTKETGGTLIENANDLSKGLDAVLERTAVTYVLTFQVDGVAVDGAFHPLRVELVNGPRGARLIHRSGYRGPVPAAERDEAGERLSAAARILDGEEVFGLPARMFATALAYQDGKARVPVLVEVAEPSLLQDGAGAEPTEVYVYAFDAAGEVADFFARSVAVPADAAKGGPPLLGIKLAGELELAPGVYELRALVRRPGTGREAMRTERLEVPDLAAGPELLPPLFVQGAAERWVMAMAGGGSGGQEADYPFTVEGKRVAPAAAPLLAPGQSARLLLPGVSIAEDGVRMETRVVAEDGTAARGGSLEILGRRAPAPGQPDLLVARFDPSGLPAGAYELEVALAGSGRWLSAPFRVGE